MTKYWQRIKIHSAFLAKLFSTYPRSAKSSYFCTRKGLRTIAHWLNPANQNFGITYLNDGGKNFFGCKIGNETRYNFYGKNMSNLRIFFTSIHILNKYLRNCLFILVGIFSKIPLCSYIFSDVFQSKLLKIENIIWFFWDRLKIRTDFLSSQKQIFEDRRSVKNYINVSFKNEFYSFFGLWNGLV